MCPPRCTVHTGKIYCTTQGHRQMGILYVPLYAQLKMIEYQNFTPILCHLIPHWRIALTQRNQVLSHLQSISAFFSLCPSQVGSMPDFHYEASQMELMIIFSLISFVVYFIIFLSYSLVECRYHYEVKNNTVLFHFDSISNFFFLFLSSCFSFCRIYMPLVVLVLSMHMKAT